MSERNQVRVKSSEETESNVVLLVGGVVFSLYSFLVLCFSLPPPFGCCLLPSSPLWVLCSSPPSSVCGCLPPPPFGDVAIFPLKVN